MQADVTIIGCGPAGIQAAIHSSRKKADTIMIGHPEKSAIFGHEVENYFGIKLINGRDLVDAGVHQAERFGTEVLREEVVKLEKIDNGFKVLTDHDTEITTKAIILAPGISRKKLGAEGEKEYYGRGVSYCAQCDCNFFRGKVVAVVGGESEAAASALLLKEYASKVYWIADEMQVAKPLMAKVEKSDIEVIHPGRIERILGEKLVTGIELEGGRIIEVNGVFIELGAKGSMELALDIDIIPDPSGKIKVDEDCQTEVKGAFACGDVTGKPWQLARAVGQGCIAGDNAAKMVKGE
ncbi:MAG: FAD-dependent oxidoreductase [Methanomassiliicoccales archaeon]|nr:FAD-dependent oxidoreductase [Methanomassiliicoccales archaeon]NYT16260.1 FAD-dependent oxidoreductase [Methanomassiliicoccales archaeon]